MTLVILTVITMFWTPWLYPTSPTTVYSDSQALGFNNRVAMIGLALGVAGMLGLGFMARKRKLIDGTEPLFGLETAAKPERVPVAWLITASAISAIAVIALGCLYGRFPIGGEGAYFMNAILLVARNAAAYSRVFSYGPALLFPPIIAARIAGANGLGLVYAYYAWTAVVFAAGPAIYAYVLNHLSLSSRSRKWAFVLLSAHGLTLAVHLGAATTAIRCMLPYALLIWSLSSALKSKRPFVGLGFPIFAVIIGYTVSPEMGVALAIALFAALGTRAIKDRSTRSVHTFFAFAALVALGGLVIRAISAASTMGDFAGGAFYLPVLPSIYTLTYMSAMLILAFGIGSQLESNGAKSWALHVGWMALAIVYIAPALGRADWGHVFGNGLGAILAVATVTRRRWRFDTTVLVAVLGVYLVAHAIGWTSSLNGMAITAFNRGVWNGAISEPAAHRIERLMGWSGVKGAPTFEAASEVARQRRFEAKQLAKLPDLAFLDPFEIDYVYKLTSTGHLAKGYFDPGTALSGGYFELATRSLRSARTIAIPAAIYDSTYASPESYTIATIDEKTGASMASPTLAVPSSSSRALLGWPFDLQGRYPNFSAAYSFARLLQRDWTVLSRGDNYVVLVRKR